MEKTLEQLLNELAASWEVSLECDATHQWLLLLTDATTHSNHQYWGFDLFRVVCAAWAGEPTGCVL
jgi:hypothetical protein